jgi:pyruvate kinase
VIQKGELVGRKVKIVATIGPSSQEEVMLEKLIRAGVNMARLNFSHGSHDDHAARIALIRSLSEKIGVPVGILQDLQGPKIRVGTLPEPLHLEAGEHVVLYAQGDEIPGKDGKHIPVVFPELFESAIQGARILLDDGHLSLTVERIGPRSLSALVVEGGELLSNKGINLPGIRLDIPGFTKKDEEDLYFGLSQGVDAVAISFVRSAQDVTYVRRTIEMNVPNRHQRPLLIAKLEKPEAIDNLDEILEIADGVMVARGDLGVEMPPERVPMAQKCIIQSANQRGKLVITATQMLDSMIHNSLPTRAEASDVANAVFDGTDAVMLSGETAMGDYPLEAVMMMDRIVRQAEAQYVQWGHTDEMKGHSHDDAVSMARAASAIAHDRDVAAITVFTQTGRTAWTMSKVRPGVPVLAFTPDQRTYQRLALMWGVVPYRLQRSSTVEDMLKLVEGALRETGLVKPGQQVVVITGFPVGASRPPNMALLHTLEEG